MTSKAATTGPGAMVLVAIEQYYPEGERIITDDLAYRILPLGFRAEVRLIGRFKDWIIRKSEKKVPGLWAGIMGRKRYIDDRGKRSRLQMLFQEVPTHVTLVPIDFDQEDLATVLASHGYDPDRKTFFIWEGVTQYLTESGIRATFQFLATAPAGSRLALTYTPKDFIDGEVFYGQEYLYKRMLLKDRIWFFGLDPENVDDFLGEYGWRVLEHLGYDELDERYVKPTGRELQSMAIERIIYAEKLK